MKLKVENLAPLFGSDILCVESEVEINLPDENIDDWVCTCNNPIREIGSEMQADGITSLPHVICANCEGIILIK